MYITVSNYNKTNKQSAQKANSEGIIISTSKYGTATESKFEKDVSMFPESNSKKCNLHMSKTKLVTHTSYRKLVDA